MRHRAIAALIAAIVAGGCSGPPDNERHQAEGALAAARAAGAAEYAPDALATIEAALAQYDAAVTARDYRQALRLAIEARDGAYQAATLAADEKARARGRAERLVSQVESTSAELRARLSAPAPARGLGATVDESRAALNHADQRLQEARSNLETQQFRAVAEALEPVADQLRQILHPTASGSRR
jgi:hypothetical protein